MEISLQELAGGALQEKVNQAFEKVMQNMQDPNTPWKNKRKITVGRTFAQNEDRTDCTCDISVDTKLAAVKPVSTKFCTQKDLAPGEIYAQEYGPGIRGQLSFEDVKTGLASKSDAIIPSPVTLKPYRTFTEVEQPESQFVFRMKEDKYDGVQCALFEADGGAWKLHAMESIQEYLEEQLKGVDGFTIIS